MTRGPFEWDEDFQRLGERVDDFFDRVFGLAAAPRYGLQQTWRPSLDLYRVADGIAVIAELPGVDEGDLQVVADNGRLRITGTRRPPAVDGPAEALQLEIDYGPFERVVAIPAEVDTEHITARFRHGLLIVHVPVGEPRRVVPVRAGSADDESNEQ
jgi:HSP20 family protein